jgi:hypothetical protein
MFFSGKIIDSDSFFDEHHDQHDYKPCEKTRLIVARDEQICELIEEEAGGLCLKQFEIIKYKDYMNLSKELPILKINPTTNLTGPCVIVSEHAEPMHGCWFDDDCENVSTIPNIVNQRNREMIEKCHVFSLKINDENDCFRSLCEWGIASSMNKILILEISHNNPKIKEYYTFASESIESLEKLSFYKREAIFCCTLA